MAAASYRVLTELFTNELNFTPTPKDIAQFEADLAVVSPSLIRAALKEVAASKAKKWAGGSNWRQEIFRVYNRKVAEQAQLFPVFHSFETAFRSTVAVELEAYYELPKWWAYPLSVISSGAALTAITQIGTKTVTRDATWAIGRMVQKMLDRNLPVASYADGYELLEEATLSETQNLILSHWSLFSQRFSTKDQSMTKSAFEDKFDRVKASRNAVYHHKSFSGMTATYQTAEELLGGINFHLSEVHPKIAAEKPSPPPYKGLSKI